MKNILLILMVLGFCVGTLDSVQDVDVVMEMFQ